MYHLVNPRPELPQTRLSFNDEMVYASTNAIGTSAQDLITAELSEELDHEAKLTSTGSWYYRLDDVEAQFNRALSNIETRRWIERVYKENRKIHFVVGYQTLENARLEVATSHNTIMCHDTVCKCPGGTMLAPSLIYFLQRRYMPTTEWIDPFDQDVKPEEASAGQDLTITTAPGEHISAVYYREVRCRMLPIEPIEDLSLTNRRWELHTESSGFHAGAPDYMIEVDLAESAFIDRSEWKCFGDCEKGFLLYLSCCAEKEK